MRKTAKAVALLNPNAIQTAKKHVMAMIFAKHFARAIVRINQNAIPTAPKIAKGTPSARKAVRKDVAMKKCAILIVK